MPRTSGIPWRWPSRRADDTRQHTDSEAGYNLSTPLDSENKMPGRRRTICGFRRKVFFTIIGGGLLIVAGAVAIGVGAGLAFGRKQDSAG
jgi:hypothetical protein